jgi:hypothetical protein
MTGSYSTVWGGSHVDQKDSKLIKKKGNVTSLSDLEQTPDGRGQPSQAGNMGLLTKLHTLHPKSLTLHLQSYTPNPTHSTLYPQPYTHNPIPHTSTQHPQSYTH